MQCHDDLDKVKAQSQGLTVTPDCRLNGFLQGLKEAWQVLEILWTLDESYTTQGVGACARHTLQQQS